MKQPIKLSTHACKRARERYQWSSDTLERIAKKAFESGLKRNNAKGILKKYLDSKYKNHIDKKSFYIYGETIYVFSDEKKLITVLPLPLAYRALAKVLQQKQQKD